MKRISTATRVADKFGVGKGGFTNGNAVAGIAATDLEADWFDHMQEEISRVIEASGGVVDGSAYDMLLSAIRRLTGVAASFAVATGSADAMVAALSPTLTELVDGVEIRVRCPGSNASTTPTLKVDQLPALTIVGSGGGALPTGAYQANWPAIFRYRKAIAPAAAVFELINPVPVSAASGIQGDFKNLVVSATGTNASVSITADEIIVKAADGSAQILQNVAVAPSLAASGANGLDSGTSAGATLYADWVIWGRTVGTAGLFSASFTAPVLPPGFTHKARVGRVRTDPVNKYPLGMIQRGRIAELVVGTSGTNLTAYPQISSGIQGSPSAGTYVPLSLSGYVSPDTASAVFILARVNNGYVLVAPNNNAGAVDSSNPPAFAACSATSTITYAQQGKILLQSSSIYHAMSTTPSALFITGWEESI